MVDTKASDDDILIIPVSVQSIILPDQNLSVSSFLQFPLPSASITTAPPLRKYFDTDTPPEDTSYLNYLCTQPLPQLAVLHQLLEGVQHARLDGSRSIVYAHADINQSFPFWILMFWRQAYTLLDIQNKWRQAEAFLTKRQSNPVASTFHLALSRLSWSGSMKGFCDWSPIHDLADFASQKWLTDKWLKDGTQTFHSAISTPSFQHPKNQLLIKATSLLAAIYLWAQMSRKKFSKTKKTHGLMRS
ncbi:hypothetical protein BDR07DRAFT_1415763 [Suillus spraguei]|nr:hypothetical protein BDR07DRAFT_1415763 [Suillus spraguei]